MPSWNQGEEKHGQAKEILILAHPNEGAFSKKRIGIISCLLYSERRVLGQHKIEKGTRDRCTFFLLLFVILDMVLELVG